MNKINKGAVALLASALFFYLSTLYVQLSEQEVPTSFYIFARFGLGYLITASYILLKNKSQGLTTIVQLLQLKASFWLWVRALGNNIAVFFFFLAVIYGDVTNANFFNMLYPAFVAVFSPWLISEKNDFFSWSGIILSVVGAFLIVQTDEFFITGMPLTYAPADWFGILSAAIASIAIIALRKLRRENLSTEVILLFTFQIGTVLSFIDISYHFFSRGMFFWLPALSFILVSGFFGILGQWGLTYGFRYVTAVHGSILSAFRILIALVFSWFFWKQPFQWANFVGALFIFFANILLAIRNKK